MPFGELRTEIFRKLLCIERGTHEDDLEVISEVEQVLHNGEQNIRLQVSLVDLIQHQVADTGQQSDAHTKKKKKEKKYRENSLCVFDFRSSIHMS